jgi:ATP-binding cassette, subfamily B, bacterial
VLLVTGHPAIEASGIRKTFGSSVAVASASVSVAQGELVALLGPSGSGKTTLLRVIAGLEAPDEGSVSINGRLVVGHGVWVEPERRRVGMVFQNGALFPHLTVADNVAFGEPAAGRAEECLELVGLADRARSYPHELSGGERQRVALARAFLADAPILILDEATSSLDSESEALIQQAMERLMKGRTSIVIAHRLSTVRGMDRILVFDRGEIVEQGTHATLTARPGGIYRSLFEQQATEFSRVTAAE